MNTHVLDSFILSLVVFVPFGGALLLMIFPRRERDIRAFTLAVAVLTFILSLHLPVHFDYAKTGGFQFEVNSQWIQTPNIHYHMGVDGFSMWLVVLTTFLLPLCVLMSWHSVHERVKEFHILLLMLSAAIIGVFVSLDLFLFYFFWEASLIPMALLIGVFGHDRRVYAAVKFFLYTMIASVFMLAAMLWLYAHVGSFDFTDIQRAIATGAVDISGAGKWLFLGFFIAFAVKVPLFPFHTWLPDAHVEAPTAGSVLLAGVLLKMGTYGLLRFNIGLFPAEAHRNAPWIIALAIIGIIYGALVAMVQPNMKKLVAYSSVSHLGFVVLGIFSFTTIGLVGGTFVMLAHGVSTGALFTLCGMIYERRHTYEISEYGGLATSMPVYATFFLVITLASIGLPLLNGFVGEFMVLSGAFLARPVWGIVAATGVIWSACYMLWMYQRVFFGNVSDKTKHHMPDFNGREWACAIPLVVMMVWMGMYPQTFLPAVSETNAKILGQSQSKVAAVVKTAGGGVTHAR